MVEDELRALKALELDWAPTPDDVWKHSPFHVDGLHPEVDETILHGLREAARSPDSHPLGVVVTGPAGAGKTHLLGWLREKVQGQGGYFFLIELQDERTFWQSVAVSMVDGLVRPAADGARQLDGFLQRLLELTWAQPSLKDAVLGRAPLSPDDLEQFIGALRRTNPVVGMECKDTLRALVLLAGSEPVAIDLGQYYLAGLDAADPTDRDRWRFPRIPKNAQQIVRELLRLLALTGPSAIAVDQLDSLLTRVERAAGGVTESDAQLQHVATGLIDLREIGRRALTVLACLSTSWELIQREALRSASDRFRQEVKLHTIPNAAVARELVEKRFAPSFQEIGFVPPYPTWPVAAEAFGDASDFTPRLLLMRVDRHIANCSRSGRVTELRLLTEETPSAQPRQAPPVDLRALDARFAELKKAADVSRATDPATEDQAMPELLAAGLTAWIVERGDAGRVFRVDPPPGPRPALHARLRRTLDAATEDEAHWAFRAIAGMHGNNALPRLRAAMTAAGTGPGRRLIALRNPPWSQGGRTQATLAEFRAAHGKDTPIGTGDLATFAALQALLAERDPNLAAWLRRRMPATESEIFRAVLVEAATGLDETRSATAQQPTAEREASTERDAVRAPGTARLSVPAERPTGPLKITLGTLVDSSEPLTVELRSLRRHMAIFAGAGSGKTVLLRRIVEECALHGVSAIVLDPNNDLALLGDEWPQPPDGWAEGDEARAREYLDNTDIVIWTPGVMAGRPLSFQPLPDFDSVRSDPDDLNAAINAAVAALLPKAGIRGARAQHSEAVLRAALAVYANSGGQGLPEFIDLLADLPDGASRLTDARRIASGLADALYAATVNDRLFGGTGQTADPGMLLTPAAGKRARVSVISFVGLEEEQQHGFVNRLQLALFAWLKAHPAGDGRLGGLFVMDEAQTLAPSGPSTAATGTTVELAQQARKYGLGLIFATQAPKGLDNRISGNAATQVLGLLNSQTQIDAARDLARTKNSEVSDIGRLSQGQFYAAGEGMRFRKIRTKMCLSYHGSPLTREEVIRRAARQD